MIAIKDQATKRPYRKPELKAVKIRPREVLGTNCHSSGTGPATCPYNLSCSQD